MLFVDRQDAGRLLGERLNLLRGHDVVVLGLPRGGVPVAAEVARALDAPLDVIVVRKLGVPSQPELGVGAIGEGDVQIINPEVQAAARISDDEISAIERHERSELERRAVRFRGGRPAVTLKGRTVVIVDDGIATGSTARAACQVARARGAARVVLAVPVAPSDTVARVAGDADRVVCLYSPADFYAIGQYYRDFNQTTDDEVVRLLDDAAQLRAATDVVDVLADPPEGLAQPNLRDVTERLDTLEAETAVLLKTAQVLVEAVDTLAEALETVPIEDQRKHVDKVNRAARYAHELLLAQRTIPEQLPGDER